ncbi:MAG: hypothetical protein FWE20_02460 [Defluviitaleaceae bacterium]|nr:hypothetical protein [Defluviitaleaceae bacterium]
MEVNKAQSVQRTRSVSKSGTSQNSGYKSEVRAEIVDIRRDSMVIKSPNGTLITGKLAADASPIDARIGETHTFTVSRGEGGEIILEMHAKSHIIRQNTAIRDALTSLGISPNAENTRIALALFESQVPITKENMLRAAQGARLLGAETLERVLFFIENDMPIAPRLTSAFDALLSGQFRINEQLQGIVDGLRNLPEGELGLRLADILARGEAALTQGELAAKLAQSFIAKAGVPAAAEQTASAISHAFSNPNLQDTGAARLAEILTEMLPASREQIAEATQARTDIIRIALQNREQLTIWLTQNTRPGSGDGTPDIQRFTQTLQEMLPAAGSSPASKDIAATPAGVRIALAAIFAGDNAQMAKALETLGLARGTGITLPAEGTEIVSKENTAVQTNAANRDAFDTLAQRLSFTPDGRSRLADFLERFLNDTRANFELARQVLTQSEASNSSAGTRLMTQLSAVSDNLEFVSYIRSSFYAQIPVTLGDHSASAELYVFRDKNRRSQSGGHASALVAIDTAGMGRFEAYVVKQGRTLSCQFRLENEDIRSHVETHLVELSDALSALDYRLEGVSYRETGESFTLLHKEAHLDRQDEDGLENFLNEFRRTSFDVRV